MTIGEILGNKGVLGFFGDIYGIYVFGCFSTRLYLNIPV